MQGSLVCASVEVSADWKPASLSGTFSVRNIRFAIEGSEKSTMFCPVSHPLAEIFKKGFFNASVYAGLSRTDKSW